jgi:L-alanine-DL-glutamate epimerase-like enolase superfamily enzyme
VKIADVTPFVLRGDESYGVRAGDAEATDQGDWLLLVRVRTDDGVAGWSDCETFAPVAARAISGPSMGALGFRTIDEQLRGRDPLAVEQIWDELYISTAYYGRRGIAMHCMSAVDNCLWSIRAQAAGLSLADALGGRRRDRIPAYASTLFRPAPEDNAAAARRYAELGFRGVKFGWGGFGIDAGRDRDNLTAIREALGPGRALMVDPGWYVDDPGGPRIRTEAQTRVMLDCLSGFRPHWVEDFAHPDLPGQYRRYKADYPDLRFAAGEQQSTGWDFAQLIGEGAVDVVQPDLSRCGGLTVARAVAARAHAAGSEVVTHSWLTDLLLGYSLHFLASLPQAPWVEYNVAQSKLSRSAVSSRLSMDPDGTVPVPTGPGLGVRIAESLAGAAVAEDMR